MSTLNCTTCREFHPDLLLEEATPSAPVAAHLQSCAACRQELESLRATFALLDTWTAPEPTPYFDARVRARLRQAQTEAPAGLWERMTSYVHLSTGRGLRPAMAGALGLAMLVGGGATATLLLHHGVAPAASSPAVNDLRIYDNNAQAVQQMDLLDDSGEAPQS